MSQRFCAQLEAAVVVQVVEPQAPVVPVVRLLVHTPTQRSVLRLDHLQVVDPRVLQEDPLPGRGVEVEVPPEVAEGSSATCRLRYETRLSAR